MLATPLFRYLWWCQWPSWDTKRTGMIFQKDYLRDWCEGLESTQHLKYVDIIWTWHRWVTRIHYRTGSKPSGHVACRSSSRLVHPASPGHIKLTLYSKSSQYCIGPGPFDRKATVPLPPTYLLQWETCEWNKGKPGRPFFSNCWM